MSFAKNEASYIIYSGSATGGPYFAKNGSTGKIDFSGSNASTVINGSINALTSGGKILLKDGIYIISGSIIPANNIILEGSYPSTILGVVQYFSGSFILYTGSDDLIRFTVKNLQLSGSRQVSGSGIHIKKPVRVIIDNVYVFNTFGNGIFFEDAPSQSLSSIIRHGEVRNAREHGIRIDGVYDCFIYDMVVAQSVQHGIRLGSASHQITNNRIGSSGQGKSVGHNIALVGAIDCLVENNFCEEALQHGIYCSGDRNTIIGNKCRNNSSVSTGSFDGIFLDTTADYNIIIGNKCYDTNTFTMQRYGLRITGSTYNLIMSNDFRGNSGSVWDQGLDNTIKYNEGYITENTGTATITGLSGSIAHGLYSGSVSPPKVRLTVTGSATFDPNSTGPVVSYPSGSANNWTGFWVRQTGSGTIGFDWEAEI